MSDITVRVQRVLYDNIELPTYRTPGSAGCDVHANETVDLLPGARVLISTGLKFEIPEGYECQIRPRSSLALKHAVVVFNTPSTIDSDYRGEVNVLLFNAGQEPFHVCRGDRIAQLVFAPVTRAQFVWVDQLSASSRGDGGWGSTGR